MRTVVVASGKGGTGKTTLTALFALRASETMRVVVADADVEASNLPIALDAQTGVCDAFEGGSVAKIDPLTCSACTRCMDMCRFEAIERVEGENKAYYRVDPWACEGCTVCSLMCPMGAITMVPETAGEACLGTARTGPIAFGQLGPGEDLSGRLVTEVRQRATDLAAEPEAELIIVDGPPGIGCPVIAALANADLLVAVTEPTLSGAHDLDRLHGLANRLDLKMVVVLNKADLSEAGAEKVRELCVRLGVDLVAELPFDRELARLLPLLAAGEELAAQTPGIVAAEAAWREISFQLSEGA